MKFRTYIYLPYNKNINANVKKLRNNMTEAEMKLWYQFLRSFPERFIRQKAIGNFILDFYCSKCRLGIEVDGIQHLTEQGLGHDEERTKILNSYGLTIIRFENKDVMDKFGEVCHLIEKKVKELCNPASPEKQLPTLP